MVELGRCRAVETIWLHVGSEAVIASDSKRQENGDMPVAPRCMTMRSIR